NAGTGKTVNISGMVLGGTDAGNYDFTNATASSTANISKATISGVSGIVAGNKVYDGSTAASLDAAGATFAGMIGGDSLSVSGASGSFADKNAGTGKMVSISGIVLGGTDAGNYNLTGTTASGSADISKATISGVTGIVAGNKVYDGSTAVSLNTAGAAFSGMAGGDNLTVSNATASFSDKNAGNGKTVNVSGIVLGGTDAGNYNLASDTASSSANISAKALTLTGFTGNNKVYDGTASANLTGGTLNGLVNSETLAFTVQGASYSDKNAGTGKAITVGGVSLSDGSGLAGNYTLSTPNGMTGDIAKATISSISGLSALDKIYNGNLNVSLSPGQAVINGKIAGDDVQLFSASGAFTDKNVGSNKAVNITTITLSGSDLVNYDFLNNTASATASITPKAVTLSGVTAGNKVYDGTTAAVLSGGTLTGMVADETLGFSGGVGSFSDKNAGTGKVVTISGASLQDGTGLASNYAFSSPANVNADISKATISGVTNVGVNNKTYDGSAMATLNGAATFNGMVNGDSLTVAGNGAFSDKNAGTGKTVAVSGITLGGADADNYNLASTVASGTASITPASISAISGIVAANKVYDGGTAASLNLAGASFNGMVAGDVLSLAGGPVLGAFSDKNAATGKTVNISGLGLAGADAGNYVLASSLASNTADITPAALTVSATGINKVYDATTNAAVSLRDNRIGNDQLNIASNGASFSDKNAGAGKTVTVAGIRLSGADAGNYVVNTTASTTATISQALLTVKVDNAAKDQGRANPDFSASYSGLLGGDTLATEVSGQLAFGTPATTASAAGNYLVSASGQASTNYALNYVDGVLKVNPTEALQSAVANVIAAVAVAPSQGNMVQADMIVSGETAPGKPAAAQDAPREGEKGGSGSAPLVQLAGNVVSNVLPGLRLSVVDSGLRLPVEVSVGTRQDSQ
ncbi:YDG domain-containing protein, partial [Janthinobacterium sp. HH100]